MPKHVSRIVGKRIRRKKKSQRRLPKFGTVAKRKTKRKRRVSKKKIALFS